MKVLIATNNPGKLREIREILASTEIQVISLSEIGASGEPIEDADTFEGNALIKATYFAKETGLPTIADDSGLCFAAHDGAPGVQSARFAGLEGSDKKNNSLLLEKLKDVPDENRTAHFACAMVCVRADGKTLSTSGQCEGVILRKLRGENGFGYDPLFYVPDLEMTFAQLPAEQKHAISHRGKALRAMAEKLPEFLSSD